MEVNYDDAKIKVYQNKVFIGIILVLVITMFVGNIFFISKAFINKEKIVKLNVENIEKNNVDALEQKNETSNIATKKVDKHTYEFKKKINITEKTVEKMNNIYNSEEKVVYLTFDDGPSKKVTIPILDLLKQENIKATFFTLGSRIEFYPEIVKRAYEEGHYIANHGYSHKYSEIYANPYNVLEEYNKTEQLIRDAIGDPEYSSHLFRFPGGLRGGKYAQVKLDAAAILMQQNVFYIDWNALTGDSEGKTTREAMMQYLQETMGEKNSVVILMHDAGDKVYTYEFLPEIIAYLKEKGFVFKNFYDIMCD